MVNSCKRGYKKFKGNCKKIKSSVRNSKKDYTKFIWVAIGIALITVFVYGGTHGWFKSTFVAGDIINLLENPPQQIPGQTCTLSISPPLIISGQSIIGKITTTPNQFCEVFGKYQGQWQKVFEGTADNLGRITKQETISLVGDFIFKGICGGCVTNEASLKVNPSPTNDNDGDGIPDSTDPDDDNDGYSDEDENAAGTDPLDPNSHPGQSSGFVCSDFCLSKGYIGGREVESCSYCNTIDEVCEVSLISLSTEVCCCKQDSVTLGCNDNDFTQTSFDTSIVFPGNCIDDLGQHNDECTVDGLLKEWSCPVSGDTCSHTFINCKSYLGADAVCSNGQCLSQPECTQNIDCLYSHGGGYVCRNDVCVEVTSGNCNQIVQDEGYQMGIWLPGGDYTTCSQFCEDNCANGCDGASTGGTWGYCCGYDCN